MEMKEMNGMKTTGEEKSELASIGNVLMKLDATLTTIANKIEDQGNKIDALTLDQENFKKVTKNSLQQMNDRMTFIENDAEITTTQDKNLANTIRKRAFDVLSIIHKKGERTYEEDYAYENYYSYFVGQLYRDAKKHSKMAEVRSRTRKGDFLEVMKYVENWVPDGGVDHLKKWIDQKKEAKEK